jgi:hypothetical protein
MKLHSTGGALAMLLSATVGVIGPAAQTVSLRPAVPIEPIAAIIDAFRSHEVVALGEGDHGNEQGHAFRLSLIRNPRFIATVNDIVVETGNALYQDLLDRFVQGEDIPEWSLRRVWQNTTQPFTTFDIPIYEEFFRTVRAVNMSLPRARQLRVLLGDPPVDWDRVSKQDLSQWQRAMAERDSHPAEVIRREVLAKRRRALMIYGDMHFQRKNLSFNYETAALQARTIVNWLEDSEPAVKVFSIWTNTGADLRTLQSDVSGWSKPSLTTIRGTALGAADFTSYYRFDNERVVRQGGSFVPIPRDQWQTLRMEDQVDAVLYLGSPSEISFRAMSPALCADADYVKMRLARFALVGLPQGAADRFQQFCADQLKQ